MGFFIPEVKNRVMSRLLNACIAILNMAVLGFFETVG